MKLLIFLILFISNLVTYANPTNPITIGVFKYAPPFSAYSGDGNNFYGFNIDMMQSICLQMKVKCLFKPISLGNQLKVLRDGSVNLIFTPSPIVDTTDTDYMFSLPYLTSHARFMTLDQNNINTLNDIKNKKIGAINNTLYTDLMDTQYKTNNTVQEFQAMPDMMSALINNDVDVIILNDSVAKYIINNTASHLRLVGDRIPLGNGYGLIGLKSSAPLIQKVNEALLKMESDGSYLKIYNLYFGDKF